MGRNSKYSVYFPQNFIYVHTKSLQYNIKCVLILCMMHKENKAKFSPEKQTLQACLAGVRGTITRDPHHCHTTSPPSPPTPKTPLDHFTTITIPHVIFSYFFAALHPCGMHANLSFFPWPYHHFPYHHHCQKDH